jgi:hypothetical protein
MKEIVKMQTETLFEKIKSLPPERIVEIEDFVDFIVQRNSVASRYESIEAYAAQYGGTAADLDPELEAASLECLRDDSEGNR